MMEISRFALERLKMKIKVLSYEAHLNRKAKKKSSNNSFFQKGHMLVRDEVRHHNLAYGFLRGTPYKILESGTRFPPNFHKVRQLIVNYERGAGFHHFQLKPDWEKAFQEWMR